MAVPQFRMGAEEAEQAAARRTFIRTGYLKIEEGENACVRFLSDHDRLLTTLQHGNPPTRSKPEDFKGKWPQSMPAVCRKDAAFKDMGYADCFLDNEFERTGDEQAYKPKPRTWALGVVRKKLMVDGRFSGFEDEMITIVDAEKKEIQIPRIVTLNYAWGNFWANLSAVREMNGTWVDRDMYITRKGKGLDSDYPIAPFDQVGVDGLEKSGTNPAFDVRNMEHAAPYIKAIGLDPEDFTNPADAFWKALLTLVAERASDEFYARFFDTRVAQPKSSVVPHEDAHEKPVDEGPTEAQLAELQARVTAHPEGAPEQPATIGFG